MTRITQAIFIAMILLPGPLSSICVAEKISIFVSIAPQRQFVQQIGKDRVDVQVLVEAGADPHTYEPKPQQMVALAKARLYFAIGVEFEAARLKKIAALNARMQVIHTDHGIMKLPMPAHERHLDPHHRHHGPDGHASSDSHSDHHKGRDPHIWLSPPLVMLQARTILVALQAVDPDHRAVYDANYREFILSLVDLDTRLRRIFRDMQGSAFMVVHPSWGTFAHTYGLTQVPIEIEGKDPKPAQLQALIEHARTKGIKVVFVQPQFSAKTAAQIARAIDGRVVAVDPLAEDWSANLLHVAEEFQHAFK